ncbi:MAG: type II toxin-antitoxin system PemK/MazF family toxin [Burkholderiaceae bacterium]|jgi:mRNA interferase MazF|nr:type II toxin-antitoxin system PemK/MazF family toxin [Burkholderiaceae bacterium]
MKRGDLVTIALAGDFGKPRPALVIQSNQFDQTATVTVLLLSSKLVDAPLMRLTIEPTTENNLKAPSQVQVDKAMTVKRDKLGDVFGALDGDSMLAVTRLLAVFMGIV